MAESTVNKDYIGTSAAARIAGRSESWISSLRRKNAVRWKKVGGRYLINEGDLRAILNGTPAEAEPA